nr:DEAD/DEAH box helicase family protein [Peptoclostridium sp. AF21-18]
MNNFDFLLNNKNFSSFSNACIEAEKAMSISPANCAILSRRALELAVKWLYANDDYLKLPYQDNLSSLIHSRSFLELVDFEMPNLLKYIVKLGNNSVHTNTMITREEAILSLHNLHQFVSWIDYCYSDEYTASDFDEELIDKEENKRTNPEVLKKIYEEQASKDKKLEQMIKENEELRKQLTEKRELKKEDYNFNIDNISEFETRKRYIDIELKSLGWDFNRDIREELEVRGMPNDTGLGYADYVLFGDNGKPLAVIEAKGTSKDAKVGQQQAKLYADCIENQYGQRPVIFLSNGYENYIWDDYNGYSERRIYGFYKKSELQLMIDRRKNKKPLNKIVVKDEISNRYYQKEAIQNVCEALEKRQRKMLLVCATGTGKTRTAISLVDVLSNHNWVKNVLFLADRKALVKQAKNNFSKLLPHMPLCNMLDSKDNPEEARIVFSTYPTMMNSIDDTKSKDGKLLFTPGYFDLIIVDESHRSIYNKYKHIFDYFDAYLVGLTATPKDEIDKNTYSVFDLENGVPTYAYEYEKAVEDGYLVDYTTLEFKTRVMEEGISYDSLSEEEKARYEETFDDDDSVGDYIGNSAINKWLFNADTIDMVIKNLMEKGLKIEGGDKLGKTIIFANNKRHAQRIVERFNTILPEYGGDFIKAIYNDVSYVDSLIDDFSEKDRMPQIAVSVDMLDTGIDVPEVLNLVFFKKVRSKTKFWQMIGRGTRLCPELLGVGQNKECFLILDFCNNFEFFRVNPNGNETKNVQTLTQRVLNVKVDIIRELQDISYSSDEDYAEFRDNLVDEMIGYIKGLNRESFMVKPSLRYVDKYRDKSAWNGLGAIDIAEIKEYITPIIKLDDDNEFAKRFDILMYTIQLASLNGSNASANIKSVIDTAEKLSRLGSIPQVMEKKYIIEKVMTEEFWEDVDIFNLEEVREALRDLIRFLEKEVQKIYYTNFEDEIIAEESNGSIYNVNDLKNYKKKVEHYLKEHRDDLAIYKLRNNKKLTEQDFETLEDVLFKQLGTKSDYEREYRDKPVGKMIREIVGLDINAANEIFSEFLNSQDLNANQIHFVKLIVDYVVKNGVMDKAVLKEEPFRTAGGITIFREVREVQMKLIKKIDEINENAM